MLKLGLRAIIGSLVLLSLGIGANPGYASEPNLDPNPNPCEQFAGRQPITPLGPADGSTFTADANGAGVIDISWSGPAADANCYLSTDGSTYSRSSGPNEYFEAAYSPDLNWVPFPREGVGLFATHFSYGRGIESPPNSGHYTVKLPFSGFVPGSGRMFYWHPFRCELQPNSYQNFVCPRKEQPVYDVFNPPLRIFVKGPDTVAPPQPPSSQGTPPAPSKRTTCKKHKVSRAGKRHHRRSKRACIRHKHKHKRARHRH